MNIVGRVCREAWASARALRGFSLTFAAIGFAVIAGLTVTVGQGLAQREAVLASFAAPDLRTFVLVDEGDAGVLPWGMATRTAALSTVEAAWMSSGATDARNTAFPQGRAVAARAVAGEWERLPLMLVGGRWPTAPDEAIIDVSSAQAAGLLDGLGSVRSDLGREWSIVGVYTLAHPRAPSGVIFPADADLEQPRSLHVTVADVDAVDKVAASVVALSDSTRPGEIRVDRSNDIAKLRDGVAGAVEKHGSTIVLSVMLGGALVLALVSLLMVNARRQEFGRRRALGATRLMIVGLVVVQGFMVITTASLLGGAAAAGYLWVRHSVLVPLDFLGWTVVAASLGGVAAQLPSAAAAGFRDPVRVLRTP
ncbi:MAG TPA: FtsX-like permease family protein [Micromonosporaceae bacterium]|nr:FtsX-like permease family protein [Micromonosporaceae bacterium]